MRERWAQALLIVLLLGQLVLLSSRPEARGSRVERVVLGALAPLGHAVASFADGVRGMGLAWRRNRNLQEDNRALRQQVARMRGELVRLHGIEEELERLSRITGYTRRPSGGYVVADVVLVDDASWQRSLLLYTGTAEPRRDQPVITPEGLVGRVVVTAGRYAKVQLITDRSSSVSAMIERTRRKGIARGAGDGLLELDYLPAQADVRAGDRVVTAGIDGIFPRGVPIGTVTRVAAGQGLFHHIEVTPAIDLAVLDQVYVLTLEEIPPELVEEEAGAPP